MERKLLTIDKSVHEAIKYLDKDTKYELYDAVFNYIFEDTAPDFTGTLATIWTLILPIIKTNNKVNKRIKKDISISITWNKELKKFENITTEQFGIWSEAYPAVDINKELPRVDAWLCSNPTKIKSNYERFLNNWFSRCQDKGGNKR
jgi:hypothetical protein